MSAVNGIGWFEIGTSEPEVAQRFYGEVFGWTFADDRGYRIVSTPAEGGLNGGIFNTEGNVPNYAIFTVLVDDTAEACRRIEAAGGKVLVPPQGDPEGLSYAHVLDPSGNHFGVFTQG